MNGRFLRALLYILCFGLALGVHVPDARATGSQIREMQRILWVLDYGVDELDGRDGKGFRDRVGRFLSAEKASDTRGDDGILALLQAAEARKKAELAAPFTAPRLLVTPPLDETYFRRAGRDGEILVGSCTKIFRFDPVSGLPLTPIVGSAGVNTGSQFEYNPRTGSLICEATWTSGKVGLLVFDAQTGLKRDFFAVPEDNVFSFKFACDARCEVIHGATLPLGGKKPGNLWRLDMRDGSAKILTRVAKHSYLTKIAASPDGERIFLSMGEDYTVIDGRNGKSLFAGKGETALFSPDSSSVAIFDDNSLEIKASSSGSSIARHLFSDGTLSFRGDIPNAFFNAASAEISLVNYYDTEKRYWRWRYRANELTKGPTLPEDRGNLAFDDTGRLYGFNNRGFQLIDMATGKSDRMIAQTVERWSATAAAFSPDGKLGAMIRSSELAIVDLTSGQRLLSATIAMENPTAASFLDNERLVVGSEEGNLVIFAAKDGKELGRLPDTGGKVLLFANARNRPYLAVRSEMETKPTSKVSVIDLSTNRVISNYRGEFASSIGKHQGNGIGFVDDERRILLGDDRSAVAFDIATGRSVMKKELKTDVKQQGTKITWFWSSVSYVLPSATPGGPALFGGRSLAGSSVIYEYRNGAIKVVKGSTTGEGKSNYFAGGASLAAAFNDGRILTGFYNSAAVANIVNDTISRDFENTKEAILSFTPIGNERFAVADGSGELRIYEIGKREPVVSTTVYDDQNWLSIAGRGYFAGTRAAAENLLLAISPTESITIDSLFDTLYRPDLVAVTAAGNAPQVVQQAEQKDDLTTLLKDGLPPKVAILTPTGDSKSAEEIVSARASVEAGAGGIGRIEWRVNGITRVSRRTGAAGATATIEDRLLLEPGANEIELVVYNATDKLASTPARTVVHWGEAGKAAPPRLFVLSIGVNEYWDNRLNLKYASSDATDIAKGFELAGNGLFESTRTWTLLDKQVTRSQITKTFDEISGSIRSSDVFILFVAGHGKTEDGRYYFLPHDLKYTGPSSIAEQGIGQNHWQEWMTRVATRKSLLMFDTCESGTLTLEKTTRGFDRVAALDRLTRATGRSVLAAASDDGPAIEGFEGHGVFAYSVLEALGAADEARTGLVQVTSLASYIGRRVPELSFGKFGIRQLPQMKLTGEDFSVGRPVQALAKIDADFIPVQPTHVLIAQTPIFDQTGKELGTEVLSAGTMLRVVATSNGFAEVARNGKKLGFAKAANLIPLQ